MTGLSLLLFVVLWVIVLLMAVALVAMARIIGLIYRRLPPVGAQMASLGPDLGDRLDVEELKTLDGKLVTAPHVNSQMGLYVFVSATCPACGDLMPSLRTVARTERNDTDVMLVGTKGTSDDLLDFVSRHGLANLPLLPLNTLPQGWQVDSTPYAVLTDRAGEVAAKGFVNRLEHLESLFELAENGFSDRGNTHISRHPTARRSEGSKPA